ncbi:uncharacterized protein [Rutidosis leptorrhynchoides]|uniref:uncharacterized protein n=1 Tax=Rutidosis leptorrhynchoides TaxID=125765 RepID=UPI003A990E48
MWGNFNFKVASSSASGRSGGIVTIWDPRVFSSKRVISFGNLLIVEGAFVGSARTTFLINIYAPQSQVKKKRLWDYIRNFVSQNAGDFIVFGDFNAVRFPHERYGTCFNQAKANDFNSFIHDCSLVDIKLGGRAFSRFNKRFTHRSLLDRFLVSDGILGTFPYLSGIILSNLWSDHCPIILRNERVDYGPIPFKLFHSWFEIKGFEEVVTNAWNDNTGLTSHNPQLRFKDKLKRVKEALKLWHNSYKSKQCLAKINILKEIDQMDALLDSCSDPFQLATNRCIHIKTLEQMESLEAHN